MILSDKLNERKIVEKLPEGELDWSLERINVTEGWKKNKGKGVKILLIDTGVDSSHEEFSESFEMGYNFFERSNDVTDKEGHGTHVAGLLTGKTTGVAPNAKLTVMKVLSDYGQGTYGSVMDGITYAINYDYDIICMSLGVDGDLPNTMIERFDQAYNKNIVMICATGNDSKNYALNPARLDTVIAVGGLDKDGNVSEFTNEGYDVLAPSVGVYSTFLNDNYATITGTSMASPLVAGAVALMISELKKNDEPYTVNYIKDKILSLDNKILDIAKLF